MRKTLTTLLAGCIALALTSPLRADDDAKAVIDKAIKAAGGEENLAKFKASTWKEKGTYYGMGDGLPYSGIYASQAPDKLRMEIEGVFVIILNGDKAWVVAGGNAEEVTGDRLAEQKEGHYHNWVASLLPLTGKGFTFTSLGESKVGDKTAVGVKVAHKGHRDAKLYFDKETGLLIKSEHKAIAEQLGNKEVNQESLFSDYRDVDGAKLPHKITIKQDGKDFVVAEHQEIKGAEKLDAKLFEKP